VTLRPARRRQGGQALVVLALAGLAMFGFGAIALDQGVGMSDRRTLQAVADSAALAGARSIVSGASAANYVAIQYLAKNLGVAVPGTCTATSCAAGSYTPAGSGYTFTFTDGTSTLDVDIAHTRRTLLAGVMGFSTAVTGSGSRAGPTTTAVSPGSACVVCVLNPSSFEALDVNDSSTTTVTGGNVVVDSSSFWGAVIQNAGSFAVSGSTLIKGGYAQFSSGTFTPKPTTGATAVTDPLSLVPAPSVAGTASSYSWSGAGGTTISPGIYSTITNTGSGTLTLNPGIYVITTSMSLTGSGNLAGSGVLLFFACSAYPTPCSSSGQGGATYSDSGSGNLVATAPGAATCGSVPATCAYQGMLMYYDRNNTATMKISAGGTGPTGTIYAKSSALTVTGSGGTLNSMIVVDTATIQGGATLTIAFLASQNYSAAVGTGGGSLLR
jgi:Flp pilus assembly protein TadG